MCVQDADDRCVLQFTLHNAAGCALHRRASRVIHRSELCFARSGPRYKFALTSAGQPTVAAASASPCPVLASVGKGNKVGRAP